MSFWTEVQKGGRVTIPASMRKECGLTEGDVVNISLVDGEIHICSWKKNLERAKAIARKHIPDNISLVDELIAERRAEASRENASTED